VEITMQLYSYFRSSAAYRVRIALNLKGVDYTIVPVHLLKNGGEQHSDAYRKINVSELVPTLVDEHLTLGQSLSILEYLEECYSQSPLLPMDRVQRAQIRSFAQTISSDIHPLNNLRVQQYLLDELGITQQQKTQWYQHWVIHGFQVLEAQLSKSDGQFCFGHQPTFADCCLIPQVYNALRFEVDLSAFVKIQSIYQHCMTLPAFYRAAPEQQVDAQ